MPAKQPMLSVIVPVYNEEDNIQPMIDAASAALKDIAYELIFVDDGSSDDTVKRIIDAKDKHIRLLCFSRNFGQTSAMAAGIDAAKAPYIALLDGDLQNDPADIPMMLNMLKDEKLDVVAGRRAKRKDGMFLRKLPSRAANWLIRKLTKTHVRDLGCTLKVFRAEIAKNLDLYGELHRFIPVLADMKGAKIKEVDVQHHARQFGEAKYGLGRTFKVASDMLLMAFFVKYRQRPMHLFGGIGLLMGLVGGLIEAYLLVQKLMGEDIGTRPLFYVGILLLLMSVQFITTGFLAELLMRTWHSADKRKPYIVAKEYQGGKEV